MSSGCSQLSRPLSRTPVASSSSRPLTSNQRRPSPSRVAFATAPLAIHNHKAIFGWAANLFLAAATSQTTTAEKSGPVRLGDPVPGRGDVEGHRWLRTPSPCCPLPTSHIPPRPGLLRPALGVPSPSPLPHPHPTPTDKPLQGSLFIYLHHPPLPACLCPTSALFSLSYTLALNLIDNYLNRFGIPSLVFSLPNITKPKRSHIFE